MNLVVVGSRTFADRSRLFAALDRLTGKLDRARLTVYSGGAKGADKLAEEWCFARMVTKVIVRPDYQKHPKKQAPMIRNGELLAMAGPGAVVVAFHDGKSPGTADLLARARRLKLKVVVVEF